MTTLLFIITVLFVAYVIYEVIKTVWEDQTSQKPAPASLTSQAPPIASAVVVELETKVEAEPAAPPIPPSESEPKTETKRPAPPKPAAARTKTPPSEETNRSAMLRNPTTGELSPVPANYRFAKKWIKEALVNEGLLDHIYTPRELDDEASEKIRHAIDQLRHLDRYRV